MSVKTQVATGNDVDVVIDSDNNIGLLTRAGDVIVLTDPVALAEKIIQEYRNLRRWEFEEIREVEDR